MTLLQRFIHNKQYYYIALKKQILMIKTNYANKDEYERNEIEIRKHETITKMHLTLGKIKEKTKELIEILKIEKP